MKSYILHVMFLQNLTVPEIAQIEIYDDFMINHAVTQMPNVIMKDELE